MVVEELPRYVLLPDGARFTFDHEDMSTTFGTVRQAAEYLGVELPDS